MKKFKITVPAEDVQGYLRYGYYEGVVEAESREEVEKMLKDSDARDDIRDELHLKVTDYEVEYAGPAERGDASVEEVE